MKGNKIVMSANIKRNMERLGIDRRDLSQELNIPYTTVTDWINGKTYPRKDKVELLAKYFGVEKTDLVEDKSTHILSSAATQNTTWNGTYGIDAMNIPLIDPTTRKITYRTTVVSDPGRTFMSNDSSNDADFTVIASDDSMICSRIMKGDIVSIHSQPAVENREVAAVDIDGEVMLRRFYKDVDRITLVADNPNYPPLIFQGEELERVHVMGKAIEFKSKIV